MPFYGHPNVIWWCLPWDLAANHLMQMTNDRLVRIVVYFTPHGHQIFWSFWFLPCCLGRKSTHMCCCHACSLALSIPTFCAYSMVFQNTLADVSKTLLWWKAAVIDNVAGSGTCNCCCTSVFHSFVLFYCLFVASKVFLVRQLTGRNGWMHALTHTDTDLKGLDDANAVAATIHFAALQWLVVSYHFFSLSR